MGSARLGFVLVGHLSCMLSCCYWFAYVQGVGTHSIEGGAVLWSIFLWVFT